MDTRTILTFHPDVYSRMLDDARQCFPDECCGFLFGEEKSFQKNIPTFAGTCSMIPGISGHS
ncbi:MAG: Mov34/MPN/PAD-1 family protein [Bacteroidota bacterium]